MRDVNRKVVLRAITFLGIVLCIVLVVGVNNRPLYVGRSRVIVSIGWRGFGSYRDTDEIGNRHTTVRLGLGDIDIYTIPQTNDLIRFLRKGSTQEKSAALLSLSIVPDPGAEATLHESLSDESYVVRFAAAALLWKLGDPAGKQVVEEGRDSPNSDEARMAEILLESFTAESLGRGKAGH